jgi:CheY-like chemotaxis protein
MSSSIAPPLAPTLFRPVRYIPLRRDGPLVLVADDHDDSRDIARMVLESAGYRVTEATTGLEALAIASLMRPAIVLLDVIMPELDGWATARRLRADPTTSGATIIALTALTGPLDREESLAAGCDELLTKPIHPRALLAVLDRYTA